jgi:hypothetical protein
MARSVEMSSSFDSSSGSDNDSRYSNPRTAGGCAVDRTNGDSSGTSAVQQ